MDLQDEAEKLFLQQLKDWQQLKSNYEALKEVRLKEFRFDNFVIKVQYNPARKQSSLARTDSKSINERKCFLCPSHLPPEQKGVPFGNDYQILVNPYPIFSRHFTIPTYIHTDQLIEGRYKNMLRLAEMFSGYIVFYNGPKCGASAPDHMHFQAAIKGNMPLDKEITNLPKEVILKKDRSTIYAVDNYLRNAFLIEAESEEVSEALFQQVYNALDLKDGDKEPMINILSWKEDNSLYTCIFPREKHRPECYYSNGDDNLLISPASVDLGGLFVVSQEKDFEKITKEDIVSVLKEVCINDEKMRAITERIKNI